MSLVILTPLFPPDPSASAQYTKLLAQKLDAPQLSIVTLGNLPESVSNTPIHTISKRRSKLLRVYQCLQKLFTTKPTTLIVQNGPSVELPALLFSWFKLPTVIYVISDHAAASRQSWLQKLVTNKLQARATKTIILPEDTNVYLTPEWLPFSDIDPTVHVAHDHWWAEHLSAINLSHD